MGAGKNSNPRENQHALFAQVETHRGYMLRFATAKLRDADQAEEVVQESLLAALDGIGSFSGQSTWVWKLAKSVRKRRLLRPVAGSCSTARGWRCVNASIATGSRGPIRERRKHPTVMQGSGAAHEPWSRPHALGN